MSPTQDPLARFSALTREWFSGTFAVPTDAQAQAWSAIADGDNTLVVAPTGSGKTLAAFLWAIDRLAEEPRPAGSGTRVLYVSPLKALAVDVERNLRTPLTGITRIAERQRAATATDQRRRPLRRHPAGPAARAHRETARCPDHHPRVAVPDVDVGCPRFARGGADRHRRRGARGGRHQTRCSSRALAGAAGPVAGQTRAAHRAVGDGATAGGGGAFPVRAGPDDCRRASRGQDVRPFGAGAGARYGQPREQLDLAGRRGAHRRPDRGAQKLDRVRQLATARRTTHLPAQRDPRRAARGRPADRPQPAGRRRLTGAHHGQRAGIRRRHPAGQGAPRLGQQGAAGAGRGRPQVRTAQGRRRDLQPGVGHRHGRGGPGDPGGDAAVGGQRAAAHRPRGPPGGRDLARACCSRNTAPT